MRYTIKNYIQDKYLGFQFIQISGLLYNTGCIKKCLKYKVACKLNTCKITGTNSNRG